MQTLGIYAITTVVFFAIDMLWLGFIARNFYRKHLGYLMAEQVVWAAALVFYFIYIGGILYFAILPALKAGSLQTALVNGALLGFLCYATYDLTNLATVKNWPILVTAVDLVWGALLTAATSGIAYMVAQKLW